MPPGLRPSPRPFRKARNAAGARPLRRLEVFLAIAAVVGLCSLGCATSPQRAPRTRRVSAPVMAAAHLETAPSSRPTQRRTADEGVELVERTLRDRGLR